jgi:hypothetical protein
MILLAFEVVRVVLEFALIMLRCSGGTVNIASKGGIVCSGKLR